MRFLKVKKILILCSAASIIGLAGISTLRAQTDTSGGGSGGIEALLKQILIRVNNLPDALLNLGTYIKAWTKSDDSDNNKAMVSNFNNLFGILALENTTAAALQARFNTYSITNDGSNVFSFNDGTNPTSTAPSNIRYANDLVYSSLLGAPYYPNDPRNSGGNPPKKVDFALNYIMNASGLNIYHQAPSKGWQGPLSSQRRYQNLFNTLVSATSFGSYALGQIYADKNQFTDFQNSLMQQAQSTESTNWFAQISSEQIGYVLRQILMYQSQMFLLQTQQIQLQKQLLTAQVMNTAVLIATNQMNEEAWSQYAQKKKPDPFGV